VLDRVPAIAWWLLLLNCSGSWLTTRSTRWSIATTTLKLGLRTSAIAFGRFDVAAVEVCYAVISRAMLAVGVRLEWGPLYYAGSSSRSAARSFTGR
jgi:4-hydroxybenzoate polyprenyltransferase